MWVDGIRRCLEQQLGRGNVRTDETTCTPSPMISRYTINKCNEGTANIPDIQYNCLIPKVESMKDLTVENYDQEYNLSTTPFIALSEEYHTVIQQILDSNPHCADCGKSSPEWASLNIGVL